MRAPALAERARNLTTDPVTLGIVTELTDRDLEILETIARRVRVLSLEQVARTWWPGAQTGKQTALRRIQLLESENLVRIQRAPAHPEIPLRGPEIDWTPGDDPPDFSRAASALQRRWSEPPVMTVCISATRAAANRFGGYCGRPPREVERTHDIHLAAVYLHYRAKSPEVLSGWTFEESLRQERTRHQKERLPDVVLRLPSGNRVIEFGGAYSKEKLGAFHRHCSDRVLPYEVW